eukprot:bmy_15168T0
MTHYVHQLDIVHLKAIETNLSKSQNPGWAWVPRSPCLWAPARSLWLCVRQDVEVQLGEPGCSIKTARLGYKAELLVNEINVYASTDTPNLKQGLKNFADEFAKLQDYRQADIERLEAKVVEHLKAYGTIVKMKRDDLKVTLTARNQEAFQQLTQKEYVRETHLTDMLFHRQKLNYKELQGMLPEQLVIWRKLLTILKSRK